MTDSDDVRLASQPHERLLFNLTVTHLLLPAILAGTKNLWLVFTIPPIVSMLIIMSIAVEAYRPANKTELVLTHWKCAWRRGQFLLMSYAVALILFLLALALVQLQPDVNMRPIQLAVFGWFCLIPISITMTVLIFLETNALLRARQGKIPDRIMRL